MWEQAEYILKQVATPHFWQHIDHHLAPLTLFDWRLATLRWSKFAKLRQQSVCSHFRGEGETGGGIEKERGVESRAAVCASCDFQPNLHFWDVINFAGCSYSQVFSVCVVWKLFFSPAYLCYLWAIWEIRILQFWRLLCIIYLRKVFLLSSESVLAELNQASQRELSLRNNLDTWHTQWTLMDKWNQSI